MAVLYAQHFVQFFDDNGDPLNGGKLYSYTAGTSTPKDTYTTAAGTIANANPVVLDSSGRAVVFLSGSYRFRLEDSAGNLIKDTDNVTAFSAQTSGIDDIVTNFTEDVIALGDSVLFSDLSDGNSTKRDTVQGVVDLILIDEDDMASNSDTKCPSQQSAKAYIDLSPRKVAQVVPTASTDCVITYQFRSGYNYRIELDNIQVGTDNTGLQIYMSSDNGSSYVSSASAYTAQRFYGTTGVAGDVSTSTVINATGYGMNAGDGLSGTIRLWNPAGASKRPRGMFDYNMVETTGVYAHGHTGFTRNATMACDKIKLTSSTNFSATGTITVWEEPI